MIIIPLEKSIDWRRPPFITFLLIIINSIILVYSQSHDEAIFKNSLTYYFSSELPKLELPRYIETEANFNDEISTAGLIAMIKNGEASEEALVYILMEMESNEGFMEKLRNNEVIHPQDQVFGEWKAARTQFEAIKNSSIIDRFGFTPAKHKPVTFLTHQFLHGGYGHLIGNMIFLFLIGFALETALGSWLYLTCYLVSGLGAVSLYWSIYPTSETALVGASGAIAGLMGMYAVLFGLRKIRFFYSLLFYFDYIKAPALIMLPLWVANEIYQLHFTEGSNVAYMAHVGGLLTGGMIAFAIKKLLHKKMDTRYLDESMRHEEKLKLFNQGLLLFRQLKIPQARHIFAGLHANYPDDGDIVMHYYNTLKFTPELKEYRAVTEKIFEKPQKYSPAQIVEVYRDNRKNNTIFQLPARLLIKLALFFSKNSNQAEAEYILLALLQQSPEVVDLDHALFALATAWQQRGNTDKQAMCLKLLAEHYPMQPLGINANSLLKALPKVN